jgi:hypothetical protein
MGAGPVKGCEEGDELGMEEGLYRWEEWCGGQAVAPEVVKKEVCWGTGWGR